jgi:hypothetical protein
MRPPCEIIVQKILPALRSELARILIEEYNFSQQQASTTLGITKAAVSQYLNSKRGTDATFSSSIHEKLRDVACEIAVHNKKPTAIDTLCPLCKQIQGSLEF